MITADELRRVPLFAALPDNEAASLASRVADVRLREGDWLIQEGEQPSFFLLLEGSLEVRKVVHGVERRLTQYNQGEYFGELPLLLGSPAVVSLRALEPSRVAQLDHADFRQLFSSCATLASELTRTMTQRVARLQALAAEEAPASVADRRPSLRYRMPSPARFSRAQPDHVSMARPDAPAGVRGNRDAASGRSLSGGDSRERRAPGDADIA